MIRENDKKHHKLLQETKDRASSQAESLDFKAKSEHEVIKVPKCTYANDSKSQTTYFLCQCSSEDFYPICTACADTCHKEHSPALKLEGIYTCNCGKANHVITRENEKRFSDKKIKTQNTCFFGKFCEITPNRGYYSYQATITLCAVCVEYCYQKKFTDEDLVKSPELIMTCQCEKHYEINQINLNVDLISKPKFHKHFQNFNFNILFKITLSKNMYLDYLLNKIAIYSKNPTSEQSKIFFSNFINLKILELFSTFSVRWENKYFHLRDYFSQVTESVLIKLMSFNEHISMLTASDAGEFTSAKFYFAEMIFNYIVRTYQLKNNNLWNIRTILNMNLYQRFIYLQEIRNFFKFNILADENIMSREATFRELSTSILDLYENILKVNENFDFTSRIMNYVFPTFNRIFKYLIKYNIIYDEHKARYFELVLDTINLSNEKYGDDGSTFYGSEFYIVKSILYTLIYRNDRICINYIRNLKDPQNKKFVFMSNRESDITCKIFASVITKFNRKEDLNRTIIYDFYIRKIFEMMIGGGDFYIKNLSNLKLIAHDEIFLLTSTDVQLEMRRYLSMAYLKDLIEFSNKMNEVNRNYLDYATNYESYLTEVNEVFKGLKTQLIDDIGFLPDLSKKFQVYLDKFATDSEVDAEKRVVYLQNCIKYCLFFQKLEEFLHIYSEGKTFTFEDGEPKINFDAKVQNEYLELLLHFLYLIFHRNYQNLCLVMNFKPKDFVGTFLDVIDKLFDFLERMSEMIYSNFMNYQFDNLYFFSECLGFIVDHIHNYFKTESASASDDRNMKFLYYLHRVMKISTKSISTISMYQPDFLNCVEKIIDVFEYIRTHQHLKDIMKKYFFKEGKLFVKRQESVPINNLEKFIISYFNFICEIISSDIYFYGYMTEEDYLLDIESVEYILNELNFPVPKNYSVVQNFPFEMEYALTRFYLLATISLKLKISTIENQMRNLFMRKMPLYIKNISLVHLSRNPDDTTVNERMWVGNLISKAKLIISLFKKYPAKFHATLESQYAFTNIIDRKIFFFKYIENIILRPSFQLLNFLILNYQIIKGQDCYVIYELVFYLMKSLVFLYSNLKKCEKEIGQDYTSEYALLVNKTQVLDFENISIKPELSKETLNELYEDLMKFANKDVKYFQIDKIYSILIGTLAKVLKLPDKGTDDPAERPQLSLIPKQKKISKEYYMLRMEKLVEKYKTKMKSTYDTELSLIKVLSSSDADSDAELGDELYDYLMMKLADTLADCNITQNINEYTPGDIIDLNINNFKFQNSYVLLYLNALFYHDSERFQNILSKKMKEYDEDDEEVDEMEEKLEECEEVEEKTDECYEKFFDFMTKSVIFPGTLNEVKKRYELDSLALYDEETGVSHIGRKKTIGYEVCTIAIKLLQNLCESHNQEFQTRFFSYKYDVKNSQYAYKDLFTSVVEHAGDTVKARQTVSWGKFKQGLALNEPKKEPEALTDMTRSKLMMHATLPADFERMKPGQRELFEQKVEKEMKEIQQIEEKYTSFFNFIVHIMRMVSLNLNVEFNFQDSLLSKAKEIKSYENMNEIYQKYSDLVVEMIQGTSAKNFDNFYRKLPSTLNIFDEEGNILNQNTLNSFVYIKKCMEIQKLLFDPRSIFDDVSLQMKFDMFLVINNVINQELKDTSIINVFINIFPPEKIIDLIGMYMRGIIVRHIEKINYESSKFKEAFEDMELDDAVFADLLYEFKNNMDIFEDNYFKLAGQMYLYLTILGEKYRIPEVDRVLKFCEKDIILCLEDQDAEGMENSFFVKLSSFFKSVKKIFRKDLPDEQKRVRRHLVKHNINNYIISSKFFKKILKCLQFMIASSNEEGEVLKLKLIYFIVDPRVYLISKTNIDTFFDEVDRSSSTTKLKSLIDQMNFFMYEVEYKAEYLKKYSYLKWMLATNYKDIDFINFCISVLINIILLMFLTGDELSEGYVYYTSVGLAVGQILFNMVYLTIFFLSKYKFYVLLTKSQLENEKKGISIIDWLNIHVFRSFLFNNEIYLMILIITLGCLGIISKYGSFLFSIQLLSVIKFVGTIKEIVIAFKLRFGQLISMIGFLAILLFFYANIGFYFLSQEFEMNINDQPENICSTLLECSITYFNQGVRSGGGIGDLLEPQPFEEFGIYWLRWFNDMVFYITVILMLLNMINGVIVSTFSQIREESNEKEEDINNKCFICNIDRVEFEKKKIAFSDHQQIEHDVNTYIRFLIYLKLLNAKDLDADQSFIMECVNNRDISCFPVQQAKSIGALEKEEEDEGEEDD